MAKPINNKYTEQDIKDCLVDIAELAKKRILAGKTFYALLHALVVSALNGELTIAMVDGEEKAEAVMKAMYKDALKDREERKQTVKDLGLDKDIDEWRKKFG